MVKCTHRSLPWLFNNWIAKMKLSVDSWHRNTLLIATAVAKKCAFRIRHEGLAVIWIRLSIQVYTTQCKLLLVAEWNSTISPSCNWWQPPPVQVECLHQLKEGNHHKRKVQRSGCKMQRSRPASSASQYRMQHNMQLQSSPPPPSR